MSNPEHDTAGGDDRPVVVPPQLFFEYLNTAGLATKLALLEEPFMRGAPAAEALLALLLEAEHLFAATDFSARHADQLLALLGRLGQRVALRRASQHARAAAEVTSASTRAEALEAIRRAWARAWAQTRVQNAATLELELVNLTALEAAERRRLDARVELLPGGEVVEITPQALRQQLEHFLERRAAASIAPVLARYALGVCYNRMTRPADAFAFLDLLVPEHPSAAGLRSAFLDCAEATGDLSAAEFLLVAEQAVEAERERSRAVVPELQSELQSARPNARAADANSDASGRGASGGHASGGHASGGFAAQQLTGVGTAGGSVRGVAVHGGSHAAASDEPPVLICESFTLGACIPVGPPAAVVERTGTRLGFGTLLARTLGIPCVTAVLDITLVTPGDRVVVDGDLGLVTVSPRSG